MQSSISRIVLASLVFAVLFIGPGALAQQSDVVSTASATELKIGAGDLLEVTVFDIPELTQTLRVSDAGDIACSLIGNVHVAGDTPQHAQVEIEQKLKAGKFVAHPQVTISVKQYATQGVSVFGEVRKPGVYAVFGPRRLLDVLSEAGGVEQTAAPEVKIKRHDGAEVVVANVSSQNPGQSLANNVDVYPGDTVVVPRAGVVYVVGDVGRPGGFVMQNNGRMSILQALAMAEGVSRGASPNKTRIIRRTDSGFEEHPVALKEILKGTAPDQWLSPDDVLVVPNSLAKSAARRSLEAVFQTATGMAVYSYRR